MEGSFFACILFLLMIIPIAILWSVWKERNNKIVRGALTAKEDILYVISLRIAKWASIRKDFLILTRHIYCSIGKFACNVVWARRSKMFFRAMPPIGILKFNMDGAARGKPSPAGIGWMLHNDNGDILGMFSKGVGIKDSNEAEIFIDVLQSLISGCSHCVE